MAKAKKNKGPKEKLTEAMEIVAAQLPKAESTVTAKEIEEAVHDISEAIISLDAKEHKEKKLVGHHPVTKESVYK